MKGNDSRNIKDKKKGGYILLYKKLLENTFFNELTPASKVVMITILLMVNFKSEKWVHGGILYNIQPGQVVTSIKRIREKCGRGITIQNVRTALKIFENSNFLTIKTTNKNTLLTVNN